MVIYVMGIIFIVYSEEEGFIDRVWLFDIILCIIDKKEWLEVEKGLKQCVKVLNMFIDDFYNEQCIFEVGVVFKSLLEVLKNFLFECKGVKLKNGVWVYICGFDLVRDYYGIVYVLEDNFWVFFGVFYMFENCYVMKCVFLDMFEWYNILLVDDYLFQFYDMLCQFLFRDIEQLEIVVFMLGIYNLVYFEYVYLVQ